mmetsp:Transcript_23389/g.35560  ORF Transcript_23389/g.35560 Transcript_23389/m.35560 type:complete len:392 (+) Transcript_23389:77-1252(+)
MGDFSAKFNLPSTGIHTVEGNVAGSRAGMLTKQRQKNQQEFQEKKDKIIQDSKRGRKSIDSKFDSNAALSFEERTFREKTVGLVTADEFKKAAEESAEMAEKRKQGLLNEDGSGMVLGPDGIAHEFLSEEERLKSKRKREKALKREKKKRKKMLNTLSFADAEDADDIVQDLKMNPSQERDDKRSMSSKSTNSSRKEVKKNPHVDTSFLPDKEREIQLSTERHRLKAEWIAKQNKIKDELLEIVYSYWDGSGHRRTVTCTKGDTIASFLEQVRKSLSSEFREMNSVSSDALLYVKEDLIIPSDITFYDLIVTKARGKSGPLFNFDVHDDIRIGAIDHRVEKDESHPGKVVERVWYERNKHIFPASRWEVYDPTKKYGTYSIHGGEETIKGK